MLNKPNWKDAPSWGNWLAMDGNGLWIWYENEPFINNNLDIWDTVTGYNNDKDKTASAIIDNWRNTLEKRPKEKETKLVETTRKKDWRICRREITGNSAEPIGIIVCWKRLTESQAVKLYAQYMKALVVELSESEQDIETVIEHDGHYYWLEDAFDDPYGLREWAG